MRRLRFPAPVRETVEVPGGWHTRKWTEQGVRDVLSVGGWFDASAEFESAAVARLATKRLTEEELA